MKIYGVKRIWSSPIFLHLKKHYCPACNSKLKPTKVAKVVNSKSEEAKNFDFSSGNGYLVGNVKFIWTELYCGRCDKSFSINSIYQAEKQVKKAGRE